MSDLRGGGDAESVARHKSNQCRGGRGSVNTRVFPYLPNYGVHSAVSGNAPDQANQ